jgi:hypothetical protein
MESCVFVCEDFPKENRMQANKATHIGLAKTSNFLYTGYAFVIIYFRIQSLYFTK